MKRDGWNRKDPRIYLLIPVLASAEPNHKFFEFLLNYVIDHILQHQEVFSKCVESIYTYECDPIRITGPVIAAQAYHKYMAENPDPSILALENYLVNSDCDECWANHIGGCTWCVGRIQSECINITQLVQSRLIVV